MDPVQGRAPLLPSSVGESSTRVFGWIAIWGTGNVEEVGLFPANS